MCLFGLYIGARQGYIGFSGRPLRNLLTCLGVAGLFIGLQGWLQYGDMTVAPAKPYAGGADEVVARAGGARGTALDYGIMIGYFVLILAVGTWFGRKQKTTKDFFFGGQRFAWWLIAFSMVATVVGSYSFVKYSRIGYNFGIGSSQTYLNDWIWFPLLAFGWLPILYFSRITSIPEYFGRRFGSRVRLWSTIFILIYLVGYVGVNLFTMGKVLNILLGWPIPLSAAIIAAISATYVTAGGQTSVIMTDLLQGVMLLVVGGLILYLGADYLSDAGGLWENLPRDARQAFPTFNERADFPGVGIFWQDAMANSAMFYFLNQGIMMRFMAARSVEDGRKAMLSVVVVLMIVAAAVVASGGWVARALVNAGVLPDNIAPDQAFFVAAEFLSQPGMFGLVLAALTAALMSTVDTLITAVAAISVNDLYKPYVRPDATDAQLMRVARYTSVGVTLFGVALVPLFMTFKSIYSAHGAFTAAVTPPLVVTLMLSVFWRRYTAKAALWTLIGGMGLVVVSLIYPEIITPFAHGVPMADVGDGPLAGLKQYKFMRAFFGLGVSLIIGVGVTLFTRPEPKERQRGLVWGTVADALARYKGAPGDETALRRARALPARMDSEPEPTGEALLPGVQLSPAMAQALEAKVGDLIYIADKRWWLGGLRSAHAVVQGVEAPFDDARVVMGPETYESVVSASRGERIVVVDRLY
ncbi:MAG: sodium:solute symporter [Bradymonadia bacterium]